MGKRGFMFIELLTTVAILGILAAIAITSYVGSGLKDSRAEVYTGLESLRFFSFQSM
jgi:prepilin-type N-terminal cleavage/methylation domain-containing protein